MLAGSTVRASHFHILCISGVTPCVACARRHHYQGLKHPEHFLTSTDVRQMAGRTGRTGLDETGEAIMIVPDGDDLAKRHIFSVMQARCISVEHTMWDWFTIAVVTSETGHSHRQPCNAIVVHHEVAAGHRQRRSGRVSVLDRSSAYMQTLSLL